MVEIRMGTEKSSSHKSLGYGVGALVVVTLSVGSASIVYGGGIIPLNPFNLPAWVFGPLGLYSLIYSFAAGKGSFYYSVWGFVMVAIGVASALYQVLSVFVVLGALLIVIVIAGLLAYKRRRI